MILIDPFVGLKVTCGNSLLHMAFLLELIFKKGDECKNSLNYRQTFVFIIFAHLFFYVLNAIGYLLDFKRIFSEAKLLDTLGFIIYHAGIFYTQC